MWECSVEAILEFHRVVNDLFPRGTKQLRFVVSDFVGRLLNPSWNERLITYDEVRTRTRGTHTALPLASCGQSLEEWMTDRE